MGVVTSLHPADAAAIPKTPSSLGSFKSRLVSPFWYRFTQVVLEKRPLNGYSSSSTDQSVSWQILINCCLLRLPASWKNCTSRRSTSCMTSMATTWYSMCWSTASPKTRARSLTSCVASSWSSASTSSPGLQNSTILQMAGGDDV